MVDTLGLFSWTMDGDTQDKKTALNSESNNALEAIRDGVLTSGSEYYIIHVGTNFDTDAGEVDEVFDWGHDDTDKSLNTSGSNKNVIDLERRYNNDFANDIVVYAKSEYGENIIARAYHATKKRTRITNGYQFDAFLGADLDDSSVTLTLMNDLETNHPWSDNDYLFIGDELLRIKDATPSGSSVTVERGQQYDSDNDDLPDTDTVATSHKKGANIIFCGSDCPTSLPSDRALTGFDTNFSFLVDDGSVLSSSGTLWIGRELMDFTLSAYTVTITSRGVAKTLPYSHHSGNPVVAYDDVDGTHTVFTPETGTSIDTYGQREMETNGGMLWTRGLADVKAEQLLKEYAFPTQEVVVQVADPLGFYTTTDTGSGGYHDYITKAFEFGSSTNQNTKNLNIVGHEVELTDSASGLSNDNDFRVTEEEFFFDQIGGFSLKLRINNKTSSNYNTNTSNYVGKLKSIKNSFVDKVKDLAITSSMKTTRTSDYTSKDYIRHDKSGGYTLLNGLKFMDGGNVVDIIRDEDAMGSDDEHALATQQSIKAYVDSNAGGISGPASSTDNGIARWDGTGGDTLQDTSQVTIDDSGNIDLDAGSGDSPTLKFIDGGDNEAYIKLTNGGLWQFDTASGFNFTSAADNDFIINLGDNDGGESFDVKDSANTIFRADSDGKIYFGNTQVYDPGTVGTDAVTIINSIVNAAESLDIAGAIGMVSGVINYFTGTSTEELISSAGGQTISGTVEMEEITLTPESTPGTSDNGTIYYDSDDSEFKFREGGSWSTLGGGSSEWSDEGEYLHPNEGEWIRVWDGNYDKTGTYANVDISTSTGSGDIYIESYNNASDSNIVLDPENALLVTKPIYTYSDSGGSDYVKVYHDDTDGIIECGSGDLYLDANINSTNVYVKGVGAVLSSTGNAGVEITSGGNIQNFLGSDDGGDYFIIKDSFASTLFVLDSLGGGEFYGDIKIGELTVDGTTTLEDLFPSLDGTYDIGSPGTRYQAGFFDSLYALDDLSVGDIFANGDSNYDIGSSTVRFANGYFDDIYGTTHSLYLGRPDKGEDVHHLYFEEGEFKCDVVKTDGFNTQDLEDDPKNLFEKGSVEVESVFDSRVVKELMNKVAELERKIDALNKNN